MGFHGNPPAFTHGQIMSAGSHGNSLWRYVQSLHDSFVGPHMPFNGLYRLYQFGWEKAGDYQAYIRHTTDRLNWRFDLRDNVAIKIQINGQDVPGSSQNTIGTYIGTDVDISGLGLEVGEFYYVAMIGSGQFTLWHLYESYQPSAFTELADFTDDTTPTAAEFQELSDYADVLDFILSPPQALGNDWKHMLGSAFLGSMEHRCRWLSYNFRLDTPHTQEEGSGKQAVWIDLYINDVEALRLRAGTWRNGEDVPATGDVDTYYYWNEEVDGIDDFTFVGLLDLDKYPIGSTVTYGNVYRINAVWGWEGAEDADGEAELNFIQEVPEADKILTGFVINKPWEHPNYVRGGPSVDNWASWSTVKNNLELLGSKATYFNYPCRVKTGTDGLYSVRRYRWLHILATWDPTPSDDYPSGKSLGGEIVYTYRGELKQVDLPAPADDAPYGTWVTCDLDSFEGLYVGVYYYLHDVDYAIEDKDP